jgi:hypothetical protein
MPFMDALKILKKRFRQSTGRRPNKTDTLFLAQLAVPFSQGMPILIVKTGDTIDIYFP